MEREAGTYAMMSVPRSALARKGNDIRGGKAAREITAHSSALVESPQDV